MGGSEKCVERGEFDKISCRMKAVDGGQREKKHTLLRTECIAACKMKEKITNGIIHEASRRKSNCGVPEEPRHLLKRKEKRKIRNLCIDASAKVC